MKVWKSLLLAGALAISSFTIAGAENLVKAGEYYFEEWDDTFVEYVDTDLSWSNGHKVTVCVKTNDPLGQPKEIDFFVDTRSKKILNMETTQYINGKQQTSWYYDYATIYPGTLWEAEVNIVLKKEGKPPLMGKETHGWQWVYSDAYCNYTICTDYYQYNKKKQVGTFYILQKNPNINNYGSVRPWNFDFKNKRILSENKKAIYKPITDKEREMSEAFYEGAYNLIKDIKTN